jgi:Flp pilus assembly pilin Flp
MLSTAKEFWKDESGLGTVEIVVILAVLVSIALIFRKSIIAFVKDKLGDVLNDGGNDTTVESENVYNGGE